jgi:shikimate dehydrogenase
VITGKARVFAVLGDPVAHSRSPAVHNAAFLALGLDAAYVPLRCSEADAPGLARALARAGGGGNATLPHKAAVAAALDAPAARVRLLGACNTFWGDADGCVHGDNTDVDGVLAALDALGAPDGPGTGWLVAGTGGSARAVVGAALERGARIAVRSRDAARGAGFARWAESIGVGTTEADACEVAINTTPLGLERGDPMPLARQACPAAQVALDLVYAPGETAWVRALRAQGLRAADGRVMLAAQAAAAFERWFPGRTAPREIMGAALDRELREAADARRG